MTLINSLKLLKKFPFLNDDAFLLKIKAKNYQKCLKTPSLLSPNGGVYVYIIYIYIIYIYIYVYNMYTTVYITPITLT